MNVIPAKVAGVKNIIMSCPINSVKEHALAIIAADLCGVDKIYRMGGAHAVSALAYGTKTIESVDKIVGPGNIYVTLAKKTVFGDVGIDNIAGPSEVVVVADKTNNPDWVAMDLFSQAEHDELAQPILISSSIQVLKNVQDSIEKLLPSMLRKNIITKSFNNRGMFIKTKSDKEITNLINSIAPEHLEINVKNYKKYDKKIFNAGSICNGKYTPMSVSDYTVGTNHVLPTSGSSKFSSGLNINEFIKKISIVTLSKLGVEKIGNPAIKLSEFEKLFAHSLSIKSRIRRS